MILMRDAIKMSCGIYNVCKGLEYIDVYIFVLAMPATSTTWESAKFLFMKQSK